MPGRLFLTRPTAELADWLGMPGEAEGQGLDLAPGDEILVVNAARKMVLMRWGMILSGRRNARGRPVMETIVNARSETLFEKSAFEGVARALVPCDGWYEWTGAKGRKTRWRIRSADGAPLVFAAISDVWNGPGGVEVAQVATITCAPNADIRPIHHRMGALLDRAAWGPWLAGEDVPLEPCAEGRLVIEEAAEPDR